MRLDSLCDFAPLASVKATLRSLTIVHCAHPDFIPRTLLELQEFELHSLNLYYSLSAPLEECCAGGSPPALASAAHTAAFEVRATRSAGTQGLAG